MQRLIVQADDLGLTDGVGDGILRAIGQGLVTGTSAMVCVPGAATRIMRLATQLAGRIGLHLQVTDGRPCLAPERVATLVDATGCFARRRAQVGRVDPAQLAAEWRAQARRLTDLGVTPTHLDTHHDMHQRPDIFAVYLELARELGVPARTWDAAATAALRAGGVRCADRYLADWAGHEGVPGVAAFLARLAATFAAAGPDAVIELACHPGLVDAELLAGSSYAAPRAQELALFTTPGLTGRIGGLGVQVTTIGAAAR